MTKHRIPGETLSPSEASRCAVSRRDILRYGAQIAPGVFALGTGLVTLEFDSATQARPAPAVRRDITKLAARFPDQFRKFEAVVGEMKRRSDRDKKDPKGWLANAQAHYEYCVFNKSAAEWDEGRKQVHACWWFLPWHRAYLYVFEQAVQTLSGDKTLGIPYWNWSVERRIPRAYANSASPLFDKRRFGDDRPLTDHEVGYNPRDPKAKKLGIAALAAETFTQRPNPRDWSFGGPSRPNDKDFYAPGTVEANPHNLVHMYVGGVRKVDREDVYGDMADLATAARDPVFFAHHCNIDRVWEIWRQDADKRKTEPTDDHDFMSKSFLFNGLDGLPIEVKVKETLDAGGLGFRYDSLDVFGGAQAPDTVLADAAAAAREPPVLREQVQVRSRGPRMLLSIVGMHRPRSVITATVFVGPAHGSELGEAVGAISVLADSDETVVPDLTAVFDVTSALQRLGDPDAVSVSLVPLPISEDSDEDFAPITVDEFIIDGE